MSLSVLLAVLIAEQCASERKEPTTHRQQQSHHRVPFRSRSYIRSGRSQVEPLTPRHHHHRRHANFDRSFDSSEYENKHEQGHLKESRKSEYGGEDGVWRDVERSLAITLLRDLRLLGGALSLRDSNALVRDPSD